MLRDHFYRMLGIKLRLATYKAKVLPTVLSLWTGGSSIFTFVVTHLTTLSTVSTRLGSNPGPIELSHLFSRILPLHLFSFMSGHREPVS